MTNDAPDLAMSDLLEGVARDVAARLNDRALDELIASTEAVRRDQFARPEMQVQAEANRLMVLGLAAVRDDRRAMARAVDDALYPALDLGEMSD